MSALAWLLPATPGVAGALLALAGRRADRVAAAGAVAVTAVTLALAALAAAVRPVWGTTLVAVAAPPGGTPAGIAVDGLSAVMAVTVAAIALAVLVFAAGDLPSGAARGRFFGLMLLFTGAMLLTVTAADLMLLLTGWEIMGAASYALIGFWWREHGRVRSAGLAFVTTRAGDLGLYVAAGCAFAATGTLELAGIAQAGQPWRDLAAAGIVLAALGKSAQLPFSYWLSGAMAGPSAVSALLHSATMVAAGAYLLLRVQPLLAATGWAAVAVAWAGAVTALLLGAVALAQRDLKQLLAASTCAQVGFMVLAAGAGAVAGGTAHLVAHAAVKSLLFLCAGVWLTALGTEALAGLRGAGRWRRSVGVAFAVGALALAGVPPLSLWVTKDAVLAGVPSPGLYAVALAAALLAAAYAARALAAVWRPGTFPTAAGERRVPRAVTGPLLALAPLAAGLSVLGLPAVYAGWRQLVGAGGEPGPEVAGLVVTGLAASAVTAAGWAIGVRARQGTAWRRRAAELGQGRLAVGLRGWLGLRQGAIGGVWEPVKALAGALARFDDRVLARTGEWLADGVTAAAGVAGRRAEGLLDGVVRGAAGALGGAAWLGRGRVERPLEHLVRAVAAGAGALGRAARRPQAGQAHLYLAQAAAAFLLLAVVLMLVR
ncbi:NADH-quinone oxidoreductase subunit L [Nonomuraea sp. ATR24]|uniref:NADH-quinone oxidoreductase subunit 5 family protein n=1 Tax=Nonomuraea sp. ATR24 TaxID=1676744 RepID=UPI0035BF8948